MKPFHVYLLRCADGSYYCGHTDELAARLEQHHVGAGGYTATRRPVEMVWHGEFESRAAALEFEQQVKGWSRAKKGALIAGDWERVKALARSRGGDGHGSSRDSAPVLGTGPSTGSGRTGQERAVLEAGYPSTDSRRAGEERAVLEAGYPSTDSRRMGQERAGLDGIYPSTASGRTGQERAVLEAGYPSAGSGRTEGGGLVDGITGATGPAQRRAIAKAITLLESTRADHRAQGDELLTALLPHTGKSLRIGISGVPGVGKSTFIESLGVHLIEHGHRVAVLAIDPSSTVSGGSILGDKTRMDRLSALEAAYIRPSPSSGTLGGVAEKTREAMLVCEAAGYDVVLVETVGVGQSETAVSGMTDMFVLLQLPNAGDDLQAIKKGVMELADLVVINKSDIDPAAATRARAQIQSALRLFGLHGNPEHAHHDEALWHPRVIQISGLKGEGLDDFWQAVTQFRSLQTANGRLAARRQQQNLAWMWERIDAGLKSAFRAHPGVRAELPAMLEAVSAGRVAPSTAARTLLAAQLSNTS